MADGGVLAGLRVLEFGAGLASGMASSLLVEHGATCVRVDPLQPAQLPSHVRTVLDLGKSVTFLAERSEWTYLRTLCEEADVVLAGAEAADGGWGVRPDDLMAVNRGLIWCSLPAPASGRSVCEGAVMAEGGVLWPMQSEGKPPVRTDIPLASAFAALLAANATAMALLARSRSGRGQRITVPLADALVTAIGAAGILSSGSENPRVSGDVWGGGLYECGDGKWIHLSTHRPAFVRRLAECAGADEWDASGFLDRQRLRADSALLGEWRQELRRLFKTRPACKWEEFLQHHGVPAAMVRTVAEWRTEAHAVAAGLIRRCESLDGEPGVCYPGPAVSLDGVSRHLEPARHVQVSAFGWSEGERPCQGGATAGAPRPRGEGPLAGLRVLDLSQVLAGPMAGRLLAEAGADVVKLHDPTQLPSGYRYHGDVNRGKRNVIVDVRKEEGMRLMRRLASEADVVISNFTLGTMEALGLGWDVLRAWNEHLVSVRVTAFGQLGPWSRWRGYEGHAQAVSGLMAVSEDPRRDPVKQPVFVNDYGTGILTSFGVCLGLIRRCRRGTGAEVHTSLAQTATRYVMPLLNSDGAHAGIGACPGCSEAAAPFLDPNGEHWFLVCPEPKHGNEVRAAAGRHPVQPIDRAMARAAKRGLAVTVSYEGRPAFLAVGPSTQMEGTPLVACTSVSPPVSDDTISWRPHHRSHGQGADLTSRQARTCE